MGRACGLAGSALGLALAFAATLVLAFCAVGVLKPAPALATERVEPVRACSLGVSAEVDGTSVSGMEFRLWRVASIDETGNYGLLPDYDGAGVELSALAKASDWDAAAKALLSFAEGRGYEAAAAAKTGSGGTASFSSLESGLYLVSGASTTVGGKVYTPTTYLESLPRLIDDAWVYDVSSQCKLGVADAPVTPDADGDDDADEEARKGNERLSQTGDESLSVTQVLPFVVIGVVLVVAGVVLWRR